MFDSSRLRRRLLVRPLEDRLPPGDVLLTGLFTDALGLFGHPGFPVTQAAPPAYRTEDRAEPGRTTDGELRWADPPPRSVAAPDLSGPTRPLTDDPLIALPGGGPSARFSALPPWAALVGPATDDRPFNPTPRQPAPNTPADALRTAAGTDRADLPAFAFVNSPTEAVAQTGVAAKPAGDSGKPTRGYTHTEILVGVRGDDPLAAVRAWAEKNPDPKAAVDPAASRVLLTAEGVSTVEVRLADGADPLAAVDRFRNAPRVAWAEPNYLFDHAKDWTPNDPSYTATGQYLHTKAQTDLAWDTTKGSPAIVIAVTDDGIGYNHPDLAQNIWTNPGEIPGDGIDNDGNGFVDDVHGWDFSGGDNNPLPAGADTHGTHVAGIAAAVSNNAVGVAGTAGGDGTASSGARLMPVRFYGTAAWTASVISQSYKYAADNGAKIINSSYNYDGFAGDPAVDAAFSYAYDKGCLLFNSAGNNGELNPSRGVFTQPLLVASSDSADVKSSFSNYGTSIDITACGSGILSTTTSADGTGVSYDTFDGTSMSTPHAAGVAALIWSAHPTWTRDQVAAQLLGTADSLDAANPTLVGLLGAGRVNAFRGVTGTIAPAVLTNLTANPVAGSPSLTASITVTAPRRLDPASVVAADFELRSDGPDNTFGTADDVVFPVTVNGGAPYRVGTNDLTFARTDGSPLPVDRYRLTAFSGASKLRDPFGAALDGDANGVAGGDFVSVFGVNPQIAGTVYEDANGDAARSATDGGLAGRTVYLDTNGNGTFDSAGNSFTVAPGLSIPDNDATGVTSTQTVSGVTGSVTDVDVTVNVTHTWDGDLQLFLIAPNGTSVPLVNRRGSGGDNFTNTTFDDSAAAAVSSGTAPFTGRFRPESPLGALNGLSGSDLNGTWSLKAVDAAALDVGTLDSWTLTVSNGIPEPNATTDASGGYIFGGLANGTYPVRTVTPSGWTATGPAGGYSVTIAGAGSSFLNRVFGQAKNNRFYGSVWGDKNANGTLDAGELPAAGRTVYLDANGNGTLDTYTDFTTTANLVIPDFNSTTGTATPVTSSKALSGITGNIVDLDVTINITHTYVGDLLVELIAPDGTTTIPLVNRRGGSGANFTGTVFDDSAAAAVSSGAAPFTGRFRPESPLGVLNGTNPNGTWTLRVTDQAAIDVGTLNTWTLSVATSTPEPFAVSDALGNAVLDLPAGADTVRLAPLAGFKFTSPADGKYAVTAAGAPLYDRRFGTAEAVPPTVSSVAVTPAGTQRSRVTALTVTFSEHVVLPGAPETAFTLTGPGGVAVPFAAAADDTGAATVVTLTPTGGTQFGSLTDGRYALTVLAAQVKDVAQNPLAADNTTNFHRLFGDGTGDGRVNNADLFLFRTSFGLPSTDPAYLTEFDYDGSGSVNNADLFQFRLRFGTTI